jgi:hypothetical protein
MRRLLICLVSLLATGGAAHAASLPADSTAVLSGQPSLLETLPTPVGSTQTTRWSVSSDGRFVAFASASDGLVEGDDDTVMNVYVKDRATGAVTLASRRDGAAGEPAHDDCHQPAISDNGARVAFTCEGTLDPGVDANGTRDVYVRNLASNTTLLVSRSGGGGAVGNAQSYDPALSETGEYVAFTSWATNLHDDAYTSRVRVYRRHLGPGDAIAVISREAGTGSVASGEEPSISDSGTRVAFRSNDPLAGTFDNNQQPDVYVRDTVAATTELVSRQSLNGAIANLRSDRPAIAGNGSAVAFESQATNLSTSDTQSSDTDVYWRSLNTSQTVLVSINGTTKGNYSTGPSLDASGNVVGFLSSAVGLTIDDTNFVTDAYVKNVATNAIQAVSRADGDAGAVANLGTRTVAMSGDGRKVVSELPRGITADAEPRAESLVLRDIGASPQRTINVARPAGTAPFRNSGGAASAPTLSDDGRFAAFRAEAEGLGLPGNVTEGAFVRDRVTGSVVLASRRDGPDGAPFEDGVSRVTISGDGRRVAFTIPRDPKVPGSTTDVYVRDLAAGRTFRASRADGPQGAPANAGATRPALDHDGSRVAFQTNADNLGNGDPDATADIHVRDLASGRTILASRGNGFPDPKSNSGSFNPDINADGTRVAFVSNGSNLVDADKDQTADAFVRDLAAESTQLASATAAGVKSDGSASGVSLDAAGTRVAVTMGSSNLLGANTPYAKVFVRDLAAGTLELASRADGPGGALPDDDATNGVISPDGGFVAFNTAAANLHPGTPADFTQVYRRDLGRERTELVSRRSGAAGAPSAEGSSVRNVSLSGGCVSFSSGETLVGSRTEYGQAYVRAFLPDCGDPPAPAPEAGGSGGAGDAPAQERPGSGAPRAVRDTTAPVLSRARLGRRRFRVARAATALAAAVGRGTTLTFRSSEAGTLSVAFERATRVRRRTRYRRAGALTRRIRVGAGRVALSGRLGRARMRPGRYRLTLTARDATGNRSRPTVLTFSIVKG